MKWLNIFTYYSLCMFHSILTKMLDTPCVGYIMQNVCRIWGQNIHCGSNETQIPTKNRFWPYQMLSFWDQFRPTRVNVPLDIGWNVWYTLCRVHYASPLSPRPLPYPLPYTIWTVPHEQRDRETSTPVVWKPPGYKTRGTRNSNTRNWRVCTIPRQF